MTTTNTRIETRYATSIADALLLQGQNRVDAQTSDLIHTRDYARYLYDMYQMEIREVDTRNWARWWGYFIRECNPDALAAITWLRRQAGRAA